MRKFLYSRWFFGFLAFVLAFDFIVDLIRELQPGRQAVLAYTVLVLDATGLTMALWMFIDLSKRRPKRGNGSPGRR